MSYLLLHFCLKQRVECIDDRGIAQFDARAGLLELSSGSSFRFLILLVLTRLRLLLIANRLEEGEYSVQFSE